MKKSLDKLVILICDYTFLTKENYRYFPSENNNRKKKILESSILLL